MKPVSSAARAFTLALLCALPHLHAQRQALDPTVTSAPRRTRLILKDGSYQVILSYTVVGQRVRYVSAERGGGTEEIPLELVDLDATKRWVAQHDPQAGEPGHPAPVLDPELVKEEADRLALSPEVAPDLHLPPEDQALALDTFRGAPELVPLEQNQTDLNKQTGHGVLRSILNPAAAQHQVVQLKGEKANVQLHVNLPELYIRLDDEQPTSGEALTVDTHGANASESARKRPGQPSRYVVIRVDVRQDARIVSSFDTTFTGSTRREDDAIETRATPLPGNHWVKIVPIQPLLIGEYALVEVLGENAINLGVWDFGIHPTAPENRDLIPPERRRPGSLEKRGPQ